MLDKIFILLGTSLFLFFLRLAAKHEFPVRAAVFQIITGAGSLCLAHFLLKLLGISLMVNVFTVTASIALGIPGTMLMILFIFL